MRFPLRYQLLLPLLAVAVVSLVAVGAIYSQIAARQTQARIDRQLQGVTQVLMGSNFPLTPAVLQQMKQLSGAEFLVASPTGEVQIASLADVDGPLPATNTVDRFENVQLGPVLVVEGREYLHSAVALAARRGAVERNVLHILFPRDDYLAAWRAAFFPPLVVGVVTIAALTAVTLWIAGRVSRATRRLEGDVQRLADGDFAPVEMPLTNDELRDLAAAVNQTAARLADFEQQVRRTEQMRTLGLLGAGLAHDMRNAATGCRMAVDLHAEQCQAIDGDDALDVARKQLQLMEGRLQQFLALGKEPGELCHRPLDLRELTAGLLPLVRPMASHAGIELVWSPPTDAIFVEADEDALGQALLNLLLNATEAAQAVPPNGDASRRVVIHLDIDDAATRARWTVTDTGRGPSEAMSAALFEPFASGKAEGIGLGLAVAREVVAEHGGRITWARQRDQTKFTVDLPLASSGVEVCPTS